jgi:hypothetical protein
LNPLIARTGVIWVWLHHTGKPDRNFTGHVKAKAKAYSGIGSSELPNWAREVLTIEPDTDFPTEEDFYTLTTSKRSNRSGMCDRDGNPASTIKLQHAAPDANGKHRIHWERNSRYALAAKGKKSQSKPSREPKEKPDTSDEAESAEVSASPSSVDGLFARWKGGK